MPPKGKKTPTRSKSPKKGDDAAKETSYFSVNLNEDWKSLIAFVVPSNEYDELYLEQLEKSVKNGLRRRFTWFSKKDLIEMINENASSKSKTAAVTKSKPTGAPQIPLAPQLLTVIDTARELLENKQEIPDNLMAQLIKGKIMMIKQVEQEKEEKRRSRLKKPDDAASPGNATAKAKSPTGKKSPSKAAKKPNGTAADAGKQTSLKKKEEEDDEKFLDDEPQDGPDHYIIFSGFYSATLFKEIDEFQIPVDCIIKFKSPNTDLIIQFLAEIEAREKLETNLKTNLKISIDLEDKQLVNVDGISKEKEQLLMKVKAELDLFWKDINPLLEKTEDKFLIQHVARLKFNIRKDPEIKSWFETEMRTDFADNLFHSLAEKLYLLVTQKRQYKFYIENLKLYPIPNSMPTFSFPTNAPTVVNQTSRVDKPQQSQRQEDLNASLNISVPDAEKVFDMRYYNELMNSVPNEYISTNVMLHCMVEQVVAIDEKKPLPSDTNNDETVPQIANFSYDLCKHLSTMVNGLGLDEKEVKSLSNMLPKASKKDESKKKTSANTPFLVNYSDEIGNHLKGVLEDSSQKKVKKASNLPFDPLEIELEMLKKSMFTIFTGLPYVTPKVSKERAARLQELLHFCSSPEIPNSDVDRAFKLFVFETMNLTEVNRKNTIRRNERNLVIPWDDPYPNISATLSEDQQLFLKNLNIIEAKRELKEDMKKKADHRASSASTSKSIKFNDTDTNKDSSSGLSSILKSRPSTRMSDGNITPIPFATLEFVQSVHFPDMENQQQAEHIDIAPVKTVDQTIEQISNTKKRDLNDWNIAEHYDPKILVQVLSKVSYTHPYVDSYYNRRDNSLMLVFSNPHEENSLTNNEEFSIKLHSDVGFRNYLEKIHDMIIDWTRDEEAKYQANLIARDVDQYRSESAIEREKEVNTTLISSSPRSKSSKKINPEKTLNTIEQDVPQGDYITDSFIGHNSLKAWKLEKEKQQQEQAAAEAAERAKKVKTPQKGGKDSKMTARQKSTSRSPPKTPNGKQSAKPSKGASRLGSTTKRSSRSSSRNKILDEVKEIEPKVQKANHAFIGYDVGNNMVYVKSYLNHMFPCNGALIKTERHIMKSTGTTFVSTTLAKDGHTFTLHVVDPMTIEELKALKEADKPKKQFKKEPMADVSQASINTNHTRKPSNTANRQSKVSMMEIPSIVETNVDHSSLKDDPEEDIIEGIARYTCFTGVFQDGLSLSFSNEKLKAKPKSLMDSNEFTPRTIIDAPSMVSVQETDNAKNRKTSGLNKKSGKKSSIPDLNASANHDIKEDPEPNFKVLPWSQLFISTPTGLSCTFIPETYAGVSPVQDNEPHRLIVKQSYSTKCDEKAGEHFKNFNSNILREKSRMIKSDGSVIKFMNDNSVEIYYPNGMIYRKQEEPITEVIAESEVVEAIDTSRTDKKKKDTLKKGVSEPDELTTVSQEPKTKVKWTAVTPAGNEYLINKTEKGKNDHINYYRNIQGRDNQSGEVMVNREDHLKIIYRTDGSTLVEFEDGTRITTFYAQHEPSTDQSSEYNGGSTDIRKEKYIKIECPGFASTIFNSKTSECTLAFGTGTLVACDPKKMLYNVINNSGEMIDINQDGYISFMARNSMDSSKNKFTFNQTNDEIFNHEDEEGNKFKVTKYGKSAILPSANRENSRHKNLIRQYQKHSPRFFIIHKDSSGTELLRYDDICEYMSEVEIDPMTAIIRDNVQGYPNVMGTTVLRPLKNCLTDAWLCEYDEKDVTPPGLRCRNLLSFPPNPEIKVPGPKFGSNFGRGLHFDIKPQHKVNNPQLTIAKRMEYRQLIEYQKLTDETKASLVEGLKNYIKYIAERAENHRLLLTHDPRTEIEKQTAIKVLQLARPDNLINADIRIMYKSALKNASYPNIGKNLHIVNKLIIKSNANKVDALRDELTREKINREAWKNKFVPSYFNSEWGKSFLENSTDGFKENGNNFLQTSENYFNTANDEPEQQNQQNSDNNNNNLKEKKFLPPISNLKYFESSSMDKKENLVASLQSFERYKPKFKHADKLKSNRLPNSIKTTRSNALPNTKFFAIEEPVRRKVHNSIVQASQMNGKSLELRRGCEVFPNTINFGILREGVTYACDFELVNVGIDACRFKIKQPPPESGLKVMFKPGPIAAGMSRDLSVVILALYRLDNESGEQINPKTRVFKHTLEICTEVDTIYMPIEAEITTCEEHRNIFRGNLEAGKHSTVRIVSVKPIGTRDLVTKQNSFLNPSKSRKNNSSDYIIE